MVGHLGKYSYQDKGALLSLYKNLGLKRNVLLPKLYGPIFSSNGVSSSAWPPFLWILYRVFHLKDVGFRMSPENLNYMHLYL